MKRVASVIGLPVESRPLYEQLHAAVWPSVLAQISASNISNYSIFRYGTLLFSYFEYEGSDYEADMAAMAAHPDTQEWWALCSPLQRPLPDAAEGEWWKEIPELFHTD